MDSYKKINRITGWVVFAIAATVYLLSAERTGSLWDCGEFIAGAYKLQVVHPPGAPLFLMVGRMFTAVADLLSSNPSDIAYSVNVMSGICTAFLVLFVFWITTDLGRLILSNGNRKEVPDQAQTIALMGAGTVAGLASCFATSIWFSAVEGEVYAMSTFFTGLVVWAMVKWYSMPDGKNTDRWLIFAVYMVGLSIGVHLLSLLTFPMLALLYYLKRWEEVTWKGIVIALGAGVLTFSFAIQFVILKLIPAIGKNFDLFFVNSLGMPFNSGLLVFVILMVALIAFGVYYTQKTRNILAQKIVVGFAMIFLGFSTYGLILLRAGANTPINMNNPSDAYSLISYLNREQYGSRDLFRGAHFNSQPIDVNAQEKWGRDGDKYGVIDQKLDYVFPPQDIMLFPRMHDISEPRPSQYKRWMGLSPDEPLPPGRPNQIDNIKFFLNYQVGWMYFRYFMWNFSGKQNGNQGYYRSDPTDGNWVSGIPFIDNARLYNMNKIPDSWAGNKARNTYFLLPFIFGLIGLFFHFRTRPYEALSLMVLFLMTGIAIIIYSNQPPNEPRERDYVLAGSIFTYCIWMGLSVLSIMKGLNKYAKGVPSAVAGAGIVLIAPLLMGFQNWDDQNRSEHFAARDYAANFLNSCQPNAIIFTHGDNDTYPLWYAQEVEGIRTDVRVVNLSLLAVDWYIDQLRRKVNESPAIKMTVPPEAYRGNKRNSLPYVSANGDAPITIQQLAKFMGTDNKMGDYESFIPTKNIVIPVDKQKVLSNGTILEADTGQVLSAIRFTFEDIYRNLNQRIYAQNVQKRNSGEQPRPYKTHERFIKDEIAILDIIASNVWDRPIYWAVTCRPEKLMGLQDYLQLEGLALRLIPKKCQGDPTYGDMPIGQGCINTDLMFTNMMDKFKWGNFDTEDLFVDQSYMPSVSSQRFAFLRLAQALKEEGKTEKAVAVINKHFESFPHMNFTYDYNALYLIREYNELGAFEDAKPHVLIMAEEVAQEMEFYDSLDEAMLRNVFRGDFERSARMMNEILAMVKEPGYAEIKGEVETKFSAYLETGAPVGPIND